VTFRSDGKIDAIASTSFMAGLVLHPTKMLDVYSYAGETKEERTSSAGGCAYGYNSATSLAGCYTEGGNCSAATKFLEQINVGFWQRLYSGPFGRAQVGAEYAYTKCHAFAGSNGAPIANDSVLDVSFRYYPF
jgi:hypothetical protein